MKGTTTRIKRLLTDSKFKFAIQVALALECRYAAGYIFRIVCQMLP
jgi:hypothetical protein